MKPALQDQPVNIKIKLAALWASVMSCYIYGDYFELYVPGKVADLVKETSMLDTPIKLFAASVLLTLAGLMIFLSVALPPRVNRWMNIGLGSFQTLFTLFIGAISLQPWYEFYVFMAFVESVLTATIVWKAFHWPRAEH